LPAKVWTMPREVPRRTPVDGKSRESSARLVRCLL
jgi:hypothetical protein